MGRESKFKMQTILKCEELSKALAARNEELRNLIEAMNAIEKTDTFEKVWETTEAFALIKNEAIMELKANEEELKKFNDIPF